MRPLETDRLRIREFTRDGTDLDAIVSIHDACFGPAPREEREAWLDWTVRNYLALARLHQPPYGDSAVALKSSDEVIGAVGLVPSFGPFEKLSGLGFPRRGKPAMRFTPELGLFWAIAPAHQRHGYATEAARAMVRFAFDELNIARLVATTEHDNAASIAVMRKLGMTIERNPDPEPAWFQTIGVLLARMRLGMPRS
jgi:RimJ/RimL family protein N-acetyltransferase